MTFPGARSYARERSEARIRLLAVGVGTAAVLAGGVYLLLPKEEIPKESQMPRGWFDRPAFQPPATWSLPNAAQVRLELGAPARVLVIAEDRRDVAVEFASRAEASGFAVAQGDETVVTTPSAATAENCAPPAPTAPLVTIRTPPSVALSVSGPAAGEVAGAQTLLLRDAGCGAWRVSAASPQLWLAKSGPGRIEAQGGGVARAHVEGGGEIVIAQVGTELDAVVRGDGAVRLGAGAAGLNVQIWGDGRFERASGFAGRAYYFVKGKGEVLDRGGVGGLFAEAFRGGHIKVATVRGGVTGYGNVEFNNLRLNTE